MPKGRCKKYKGLDKESGTESHDRYHYLSYRPKIVMQEMLTFVPLVRHPDWRLLKQVRAEHYLLRRNCTHLWVGR